MTWPGPAAPPTRLSKAARAWKQAEDEGRTRRQEDGRPSNDVAQSGQLILQPREHFGRMFGVSKNYVEMARRVLDYSAELVDQVTHDEMEWRYSLPGCMRSVDELSPPWILGIPRHQDEEAALRRLARYLGVV